MKLINSHMHYKVVKVQMLFLYCLFFLLSTTVLSSPILTDQAKVKELIELKKYGECIAFSNSVYLSYLEKGDSLSAYTMLIDKLFCLKESKSDADFVSLANKILSDLSPQKYMDQHRSVRELRCKYLAHKDRKAYLNELREMVVLEKKYGVQEKYIDVLISYCDALMIIKEDGFDESVALLNSIASLEKNDYQHFAYNRELAYTNVFIDAKKADSLYLVAIQYIEAAPLIKTKAGILREYSQFLGNNSQYAASIDYGVRSLEYYEMISDRMYYPMSGMLSYLSNSFRKIGQLDVARQYMDRAIHINIERDLKYRDALRKANADLLIVEGKRSEAIEEYKIALAYFVKEKEYGTAIETFVKYGTNFIELGEINLAEQVEKDLKNYLLTLKDADDFYEQYFLFARIAEYNNDVNRAEQNYLAALDSEKSADLNVVPSYKLEAFKALADINKNRREFDKAYSYTQKFLGMKDSLNNNIELQNALSIEAKYNREQQNDKIALLDSENQIQELRISGQRKFLIFTTCSFLAFVVLSMLLLRLFRKVKLQNQLISKSLDEKDTLLKEIHHRVKNNLQLVSSLLTLQSRDIKDVNAIEAINEGKSRVRSMALIHQDLYSKNNLKGIGMKKYLENLSQELFSTYQLENQNIKLELDIDDIYLDVDTIVPIGLIINELITNALKYAFDGKEIGTLSIAFAEIDNSLVLDVRDDGKGMVQDGFNKSNSFGNKLIKTLTEQLDGTLNVDGHNGTHIHLEFKDYKLAS